MNLRLLFFALATCAELERRRRRHTAARVRWLLAHPELPPLPWRRDAEGKTVDAHGREVFRRNWREAEVAHELVVALSMAVDTGVLLAPLDVDTA